MKHSKNKQGQTGYYGRVEWPHPGTVLNQYKHVVDILSIIKDEETERKYARFG